MLSIKYTNWKRFRKVCVYSSSYTSANLDRSQLYNNSKIVTQSKFVFQNAEEFYPPIRRCLPDRQENLAEGAEKYKDCFDFRQPFSVINISNMALIDLNHVTLQAQRKCLSKRFTNSPKLLAYGTTFLYLIGKKCSPNK